MIVSQKSFKKSLHSFWLLLYCDFSMIEITTNSPMARNRWSPSKASNNHRPNVGVRQETTMLITKDCSIKKLALLCCLLALQPLSMQSASESERIEKLERAVELLQKQNTELKAQVSNLKPKEAG